MSEITATTIATSRYAPEGSANIELYNVNGAEDLTLAQMIISVCVRRAAYLERASVVYENQILNYTEAMDEVSADIEEVVDETTISESRWQAIRSRLISKYPDAFTEDGMTSTISNSDGTVNMKLVMDAYDSLRTGMTTLNSAIDRVAIDLQSLVSRRDTLYNVATSTTTHTLKTGSNTAANFV